MFNFAQNEKRKVNKPKGQSEKYILHKAQS